PASERRRPSGNAAVAASRVRHAQVPASGGWARSPLGSPWGIVREIDPGARGAGRCATARAAWRLVRALIDRFGDARGQLIPSARERRLGLVQAIGPATAWAVRPRPDGRQALYAAPGARQTGKGRPMSAYPYQ